MLNILQITSSYYRFPIISDVFETGLLCSQLILLSSKKKDNNISSLRNNTENLQIK